MSPIRPDLPGPCHAATQPVATTAARTAQAAFFQQALSQVKAAQVKAAESQARTEAHILEQREHETVRAAAPGSEAPSRDRRPGSLIDIRV